MFNKLDISAYFNPRRDCVEIYASGYAPIESKGFYCEPVKSKLVCEGELIEPMIEITHGQAQMLMDSLWNCGLRPQAAKSSIGQVDAMQAHLDDMRKLVFESRLIKR